MTLKISIAIATAGRREVLSDTIRLIAEQAQLPDELLICPARDEDLDLTCLESYPGHFQVCRGPIGSSPQRNVLLEVTGADVIVFMDDDFLPCGDYVQEVQTLFNMHPEVVCATGKVLADGITGPGLSYMDGMSIIQKAGANLQSPMLNPVYNGYGCNFCVRVKTARENNIRFDERLPLYAWLEDLDFSRQISPFGSIVKVERLRGVHLGTKRSGRSPGKRLGYSQVANPLYLARKGTMEWSRALRQVVRNLIANFLLTFSPEPWVDRRGRLFGNLQAISDLLFGKMSPEKASKL